MKWISIKERLPTNEDYGRKFLCAIKECTYFQKLEIAEWFNPMIDDEEPIDDHENPHFSIEVKFAGQQSLESEVTHWMPLPEFPPK